MSYITTGQLCSYLGIDTPNASDNVQLAGFITAAQSIIERQTHRTFQATADTTRYIDARGSLDCGLLWLGADLCQITSVTNGDGVLVLGTQYITEPRNLTPYYALRIRSDANVSWTYAAPTPYENAIAIVGRWAYSVEPPADIVQATARLASYLYKQKDTGQELDRALIAPGGTMVLPAVLPNDVLTLIRPYRRAF